MAFSSESPIAEYWPGVRFPMKFVDANPAGVFEKRGRTLVVEGDIFSSPLIWIDECEDGGLCNALCPDVT